MKKTLSSIAALAIMASAGLAMAATANGTIKSLDAAKRVITLDGGQHYVAEKSVDWSKLKVGEKVTITYQVKSGTNEASAVKAM